MSWNRDYRPQRVADLHLTKVREYLLQLMRATSFPQVFLFTGPKGTGKTSTSRILGAILNDDQNQAAVTRLFFAHQKPAAHLVEPDPRTDRAKRIFAGESYLVQELDAASNRRIDDVRALKDQVQLAPVDGLIKVYILDEVHMLTTEAFNALLKMLEEPPPHVVFILATTEIEKVPPTVRSRCQVLHFAKATYDELVSALKPILKHQKLKIESEVIEEVVAHADGSFRDAVKNLEMISHLDQINLEAVRQLLGNDLLQQIESLVTLVLDKQASQVVGFFENLRDQGVAPDLFYKNLITYLHQRLINAVMGEDQSLTDNKRLSQVVLRFFLDELTQPGIDTPSPIPFLRLELKLLQLIDRATNKKSTPSKSQSSDGQEPGMKKASPEQALVKTNPVKNQVKTAATSSNDLVGDQADQVLPAAAITPLSSQSADVLTGNGEKLCQEWSSFVNKVAEDNFSLATLLKSARPIAGDHGEVTLSVYYRFHQEQLAQPRFQATLNELIANAYGGPLKISCVLDEQPAHAELTEPTLPDQLEKLAVEALM